MWDICKCINSRNFLCKVMNVFDQNLHEINKYLKKIQVSEFYNYLYIIANNIKNCLKITKFLSTITAN